MAHSRNPAVEAGLVAAEAYVVDIIVVAAVVVVAVVVADTGVVGVDAAVAGADAVEHRCILLHLRTGAIPAVNQGAGHCCRNCCHTHHSRLQLTDHMSVREETHWRHRHDNLSIFSVPISQLCLEQKDGRLRLYAATMRSNSFHASSAETGT